MLRGEVSVARKSLNLKMMLEGGQSFRWKETTPCEWTGTFSNAVWTIKQFDDFIEYHIKGGCIPNKEKDVSGFSNSNSNLSNVDQANVSNILRSYLRLDAPLDKYYDDWSKKDPNFKQISSKCYGIRILNQDPVENVFSFICSSNNNIKRISSLVEKLCKLYGPRLCEIDGIEYYGFPEISALATSEEGDLRKAGFGYRAKFICGSAKLLESFGGLDWLQKLKTVPYSEAKCELMKLPGIGAKVADCICLMSLGHMEALPVDTHVYQIASNIYMPHLKKVKNLTDRIYNEIGDYFRELYGPLAGWAHTVLFCGDLKVFKDLGNSRIKSTRDNAIDDRLCQPHKKTKTGLKK